MTARAVTAADLPTWQIHQGDALAQLALMPDESVNCCVTSPPYFGLRSYDEDAVTIDPNLDAETKEWLELELIRRGINAR